MVIAVTTRSPFGEPQRATGRWLPYLRLAMLRNTAGLAGIALLSAAVLGGSPAWIGPLLYWTVAEFALALAWHTPWTWPARPPHDRGAAICAALVFATGIVVTTTRGARDSSRE